MTTKTIIRCIPGSYYLNMGLVYPRYRLDDTSQESKRRQKDTARHIDRKLFYYRNQWKKKSSELHQMGMFVDNDFLHIKNILNFIINRKIGCVFEDK